MGGDLAAFGGLLKTGNSVTPVICLKLRLPCGYPAGSSGLLAPMSARFLKVVASPGAGPG